MKRNTRIIQISGFKGLALIAICVSCLFAGFVIFPAYVSMYGWNFVASKFGIIPQINIFQGLLLWAGIAISLYLSNEKQKSLFTISSKKQLTEDEVRKLINRIRLQKMNMINDQMVIKSADIKPVENKVKHDESEEKENV